MKQHPTPQEWLQLDKNVRIKLAMTFRVPKSAVPMMQDNKIVSDGHTIADLQHISIGKMLEYLGLENGYAIKSGVLFDKLFNKVIEKIYGGEAKTGGDCTDGGAKS